MQNDQPPPRRRRQQPISRAIQLPPPPVQRLTPTEVGAVMKRARKLGRSGELTPYDHRVLDALLFQCRNPMSGAVVVSYSAIERITRIARPTIIKAVTRLIGCGLLNKIKRRLRVTWHQGGTASLQAPNAYSFNVPGPGHTESSTQAVNQTLEITYLSQQVSAEAKAARDALAAINKRRLEQAEAANHTRIALAMQRGRFVAG